jgi:MYXO-CTERM domain-containing protein
MNPMKGNKNALWALLAAGGLWAWQNRDKIQGWVNNQRSQMSDQSAQPATGPTRRIGADDFSTTSPRIYSDPADRNV